jgi:ribosomal protein S18 acetylase RimI-like enzyme
MAIAHPHITSRLRKAFRRHGLNGTLQIAGERFRTAVFMREAHHWYELELAGERPRREMPEGLRLVEATEAELPLLDLLPAGKFEPGRVGLGERSSLWLVLDGEKPAFACWTFYGSLPVHSGRRGTLELPESTIGLENSVTSPDFRGRGIAPAAWTAIADELQRRGVRTMLTKVGEQNIPSRKAVEKAGFQDVAVMRTAKIASWRRIEVDASDEGIGLVLQARLTT